MNSSCSERPRRAAGRSAPTAPGCRRRRTSARTWPVARRLDLLGERRGGQVAERLGQPAHAAAPAAVAVAEASGGLPPRSSIGGVGNIAPPTAPSRPAARLSTSVAQVASVPKRLLQTPTPRVGDADGASANSCASRRIVSGATPVCAATRSGVKAASRSRTSGQPVARPRRCASSSTRPSATSACTIASRSAASPPGRIGTHSSASRAVSVRRGSTTTIRPPRARMARSRRRTSGAVMKLPFDTTGLAPMQRK